MDATDCIFSYLSLIIVKMTTIFLPKVLSNWFSAC